jgi:hypothetical protein
LLAALAAPTGLVEREVSVDLQPGEDPAGALRRLAALLVGGSVPAQRAANVTSEASPAPAATDAGAAGTADVPAASAAGTADVPAASAAVAKASEERPLKLDLSTSLSDAAVAPGSSTWLQVARWGSGSLGVVAGALGAWLRLDASSRSAGLAASLPTRGFESQGAARTAARELESIRSAERWSTGLFIGGALALGTAAVLVLGVENTAVPR